MAAKKSPSNFLFCLNNGGYPASLEARKIYRALPDAAARAKGFVRIIDESGEDYLYPANRFVPVQLPIAARRTLARAS